MAGSFRSFSARRAAPFGEADARLVALEKAGGELGSAAAHELVLDVLEELEARGFVVRAAR